MDYEAVQTFPKKNTQNARDHFPALHIYDEVNPSFSDLKETIMSAVPDYEVVVAQTAEEIAECFNVRVNVFITEQGFDIDTEKDQCVDTTELIECSIIHP